MAGGKKLNQIYLYTLGQCFFRGEGQRVAQNKKMLFRFFFLFQHLKTSCKGFFSIFEYFLPIYKSIFKNVACFKKFLRVIDNLLPSLFQ